MDCANKLKLLVMSRPGYFGKMNQQVNEGIRAELTTFA